MTSVAAPVPVVSPRGDGPNHRGEEPILRFRRGDRVLVRAKNVLYWVNARSRGGHQLDAVPATVEIAPKGNGHYLLRSDLLSGTFAAPASMIELVTAAPGEEEGS